MISRSSFDTETQLQPNFDLYTSAHILYTTPKSEIYSFLFNILISNWSFIDFGRREKERKKNKNKKEKLLLQIIIKIVGQEVSMSEKKSK